MALNAAKEAMEVRRETRAGKVIDLKITKEVAYHERK